MHSYSFLNYKDKRQFLFIALICITTIFFALCSQPSDDLRWNKKYNYLKEIKPIKFHYYHGILAGSYPEGIETTEIRFDDVCAYLGHVCLCGAGGYRIATLVVDSLSKDYGLLEREEFVLVSSRDHTVSDVIAYILGVSKRQYKEKSTYFIDNSIEAPRREYHYFIGSRETNTAFHVTYKKFNLIGHAVMDSLWKIEKQFDVDPISVPKNDVEKYSEAMEKMVKEIITGKRDSDLFKIKRISYKYTFSKFVK